jgi:hypothetical protein
VQHVRKHERTERLTGHVNQFPHVKATEASDLPDVLTSREELSYADEHSLIENLVTGINP